MQDGWSRKTNFTYIDVIPTIQKEGTGTGTLWFGPKLPVMAGRGGTTRNMSRFNVGNTPVFADIDDVDSVYRMVLDLREQFTRRDASLIR